MRNRLRVTIAGALLAAASVATLTACSTEPVTSTDSSTSVASDSTAPLGTYGNGDSSNNAPTYHFAFKQKLPDGREVLCVYAGDNEGGGPSCDWAAADANQ